MIGRLTPEDFVRAWQTAPTLAAVAELAGIRPAYASLIAGRLRARGVKLRTFKGPRFDVAKLKAIAGAL